jgi:hypothetical protein
MYRRYKYKYQANLNMNGDGKFNFVDKEDESSLLMACNVN